MATQTFTKIGGTDNNYHLSLVLSSTSNTDGNYSDIDYVLAIHGDNAACAYQYANGNAVSLVIDDNTIADTANFGRVVVSGITTVTLLSGTTRVTHNSDGTKTIAVSAIFKQSQNSNFNFFISGEMALDTIPRASVPTLLASSVDFGSTVTINTNRASTGFTHILKYKFGTKSGTIASGIGDSTSWTVSNSLMEEIPNATSGVIQIICETYSGSTLIGTKQTDLTATVPANIVPTLSVTVSEAATLPDGITGYVQLYSRLKVVSTATGSYGASIQSYSVTADEKTYTGSTVTTEALQSSGPLAVNVTVKDSRGRTTSKVQNITVAAYSPPKITGVQAYRCASATDTTADSDGAYICVKPAGSITALSNNKKVCTVYYKKASATYYSSKEIPMTSYTLTDEYAIIPADVAYGYDVYVALQDSFGTTKRFAVSVLSASAFVDVLFELEEKVGMAIGKIAELVGWLDIGWPARFREYAQFDKPIDSNVYATGDVAANVSGTNPISLTQFYNQLAVIRGSSASGITYSAVPTVTLLPANADGNPAGSNLCILITFQIDSAEFGIQIGLPLAGATGVYKRECINGTWVAWRHLS